MVRANPLNFLEYLSKNNKDGHSLFLYELNVIESKVFLHKEYNYNYNRNTINTMTTNPHVNFSIKFNTIGV